VQTAERRDARRLAAAVAAAILVHVGLIFGIPFLTSLDTAPLPDYGPIVVTLEGPATAFEPPEPEPAEVVKPAPAPQPAPVPRQTPAPKPAPAASTPTATAAAAAPATPRPAPGTPAFRQAGAATGTSAGSASESIVSGPPPVILPAVGSSTTPGSGEQRSGVALPATPGAHATASSGALDTRRLDQSLAAAGTGGSTTSTAATGGRTGTAAAGADIEWENPEAAKGRQLVSAPLPRLPDSVKELGRDLEVRIAFSVNAEGLVTSVQVVQGSGSPDVDAACLAALRQYRFSAATGAAAIRGARTFRVTQR
jgi:TonB family protein